MLSNPRRFVTLAVVGALAVLALPIGAGYAADAPTAASTRVETQVHAKSMSSRAGLDRVRVTVKAADESIVTGKIVIKEEKRLLGRATLVAHNNGTVIARLAKKLSDGMHQLTVSYQGNSEFAPCSNVFSVWVLTGTSGRPRR